MDEWFTELVIMDETSIHVLGIKTRAIHINLNESCVVDSFIESISIL